MSEQKEHQEITLKILLDEYKLVNSDINLFINRQEKIINVTFLFFATFLFGLVKDFEGKETIIDYVIPIIPFIALFILSFMLYYFDLNKAKIGYRKYLEERINDVSDGKNLIRSKISANFFFKNSPYGNTMMALYLMGFVMLLGTCIYHQIIDPAFGIIPAIIFAIIDVFIAVYIFYNVYTRTLGLSAEVYGFSKQQIEGKPRID